MRYRKVKSVFGLSSLILGGLTAPHTANAQDFFNNSALQGWRNLANSTGRIDALPVVDLNGASLDVAKTPGWKVVYFWSAECPCVTACENYTLKPLAAKYAGRVSFYAVDAGAYDLAKPVAELQAVANKHHLPYAVVLDNTHETVKALDAQVTPEVFLLDPHNNIVYSGMPDDSKRYLLKTGKHGVTSSYLSRALDDALAGKRISQAHTELEGCIIGW